MGKLLERETGNNCPRCGKQKEITQQDILLALLEEFGAKTNHKFNYCHCPSGSDLPKFVSGNWLTQSRAERKGDIWVSIWKSHNLPKMKDCRDLNYKYAVVDERIICKACGDYYDITSEVLK